MMVAKVAVVMGSQSDWPTMQAATSLLAHFDVVAHCQIISAHRTPTRLVEFAQQAHEKQIQVIIAGAGGSAHLPGMLAAHTHLPVFGVPIRSRALSGMDSLLSIVQMPKGVAVGTLAIGEAGAANAALLAVQVLSLEDTKLREKLLQFRAQQTQAILDDDQPRDDA